MTPPNDSFEAPLEREARKHSPSDESWEYIAFKAGAHFGRAFAWREIFTMLRSGNFLDGMDDEWGLFESDCSDVGWILKLKADSLGIDLAEQSNRGGV